MKQLHRWLIPSVRNRYHPKILESVGLGIIALVLAGTPLLYNLTTAGTMQVLGYATDINAAGLDTATNSQRLNNGLAPLNINAQLTQAATAKAAHMFANDYWAHTAPDGTTPWSFVQSAGYAYAGAGENLAKNFLTSTGVVTGWMNSAAHRANILNGSFIDVGYGIVNGTLQGQEVTLVVALYGTPATIAQTTPPATPSTVAPAAEEQTQTPPPVVSSQPSEDSELDVAVAAPATADTTETVTNSDTNTTTASAEAVAAPIDAYIGLNWAQRASLFIMAAIGLLYVMKHTLVWRARRRGVRQIWLRSHPLSQATVLGVAVIIVLASGSGVVL